MISKEVTIDSMRTSLMSNKRVIILKGKDTEQYLPIYMGPSQANILKRELMGIRFYEPRVYEQFLAGTDISGSVLESVIIDGPENRAFHAKLLLTEGGNSFEMDCSVAAALALGFRRNASILVDETTFHKAGITLSE